MAGRTCSTVPAAARATDDDNSQTMGREPLKQTIHWKTTLERWYAEWISYADGVKERLIAVLAAAKATV